MISDKEGRHLIILGTLFHVAVLMVNAPNFDSGNFMNIPDLISHSFHF